MKIKLLLLLIILSITISTAGCQAATSTPSPLSATLSELSGKVDARQAEQEQFTSASANTSLDVNGQIQTGDDGRARLDLSTGTIIRVGPSSIFTLVSNDEAEGGLLTKIKMEVGKVFIILNGGSAEVETPSGIASVRGSYMKVEVDPETFDIYITCLEGDCSANNPAGAVDFSDGQKVILFHRDPVTGNWTAPNVEPMTPEEFQEWLDENPEAKELFEQAVATLTALVPPTETPTLTSVPSLTASPTLETVVPEGPASSACFQIIQPKSGASFPKAAPVSFEWENQPGAQRYIMTFINESGWRAVIETTNTQAPLYIEIFPNGGEYNWSVAAIDASGNEICSTGSASFSKPQGDPTPKPTKPKPQPVEPQPTACNPNDVCDPNIPECYDVSICG